MRENLDILDESCGMKQHRVRTARIGANGRVGQGRGRQKEPGARRPLRMCRDRGGGPRFLKVMNLITQAGFTQISTRWGEVANNHSYIQKENTKVDV